jgi:hypothetical protein
MRDNTAHVASVSEASQDKVMFHQKITPKFSDLKQQRFISHLCYMAIVDWQGFHVVLALRL